MTVEHHEVRMHSSVESAAALAELLPRLPDDVRARVLDQLWLRAVFHRAAPLDPDR
jgi:hypothetical protein